MSVVLTIVIAVAFVSHGHWSVVTHCLKLTACCGTLPAAAERARAKKSVESWVFRISGVFESSKNTTRSLGLRLYHDVSVRCGV